MYAFSDNNAANRNRAHADPGAGEAVGASQRRRRLALLAFASLAALAAPAASDTPAVDRVRHYAPNGNFDANGVFLPAQAGFDIADVSTGAQLDRLPDGVKGLVWIDQCQGVNAKFEAAAGRVINDAKLFGFYLVDEPDPTGRWHPLCKAADLRAESDWIHQRRPGIITFIELMNLSSAATPSFSPTYAPENTHIDLFGLGAYPCRPDWPQCDYAMIDRVVAAVVKSGIPLDRVVPTFQAFGGGIWDADSGGGYRLPTSAELETILERWKKFVPAPVFDYAYSWGRQGSDDSLVGSAALQAVFARHNRDAKTPPQ